MRKLLLSFFLSLAAIIGVQAQNYVKVTANQTDWSGDYLIVYESGRLAFNGGLTSLDGKGNYEEVTISNGVIESSSEVDAMKFTVASVSGGYSIKSASGYYIGRTTTSNGLNSHTSTEYVNTISFTDGNTVITSSGGPALQFYNATNEARFRYYKSTQQAIALYKYIADDGKVLTPSITPTDYNLSESTEISISCGTNNATIYYTTNGAEPSESATPYEGPFTITTTTTVKAIAVAEGMKDSDIATATYNFILATPEITPSCTFKGSQEVVITCATESASIYYTTDGSEPSVENGTLYNGTFSVSATTTVKAIAVAEGMDNSAIVEATYTILGENTYIVTYDFTNPASLNPTQETPESGKEISVNDVSFTNGNTSLLCVKNTASNNCRLWGTTSGCELRTYTNSTITISGNSAKIVSVEFDGSKAGASQLSANSGTLSGSSWVCEGDVNSVVFTAKSTTNIEKITVTYEIETYYHELNVSSAGWATLYLGYNATIPADVKVYTATIDGTVATLNEVTGVLPANTGVIVNAAQGSYRFLATSNAASEVAENDLVGTLYNKTLTPGTNNYYILANGANGIGLYIVDEDPDTEGYEAFTMGANKAYLSIEGGAESNGFSFRIEGTTAIDEVNGDNGDVEGIYDLTGRRVESINAPGIYIVNGKKVVIK